MIDIENIVFDTVRKAVIEKYPNAQVLSEYVVMPTKMPCVSIYESNNVTLVQTQDENEFENHARVLYLVNVYSNKKNLKKSEAKAIANIVDMSMQKMNFTRLAFEQMPNADSSVYRITLTYKGIVEKLTDGKYKIYN